MNVLGKQGFDFYKSTTSGHYRSSSTPMFKIPKADFSSVMCARLLSALPYQNTKSPITTLYDSELKIQYIVFMFSERHTAVT